MSVQAPTAVVMIRPHHFRPNPETMADNAFQTVTAPGLPRAGHAELAFTEVTEAARVLTDHGITVHLFEDTERGRPDSVFPNNWFSTHAGGHIAIFPMFTPNRRGERRADIVELLKSRYRVQDVIDYSGLEQDEVFLEGTGAMVLDQVTRVAYVARSHRADPIALERFCTNFGYEPMVFDSVDEYRQPIYHTNVMMCVGTDVALIGLDTLVSRARREQVRDRLAAPGRAVVDLSHAQIREFAGNAIELRGSSGRVLVMSSRAARSLTPAQRFVIEATTPIVALDVPTIELAGGSVRCMIAGIHLDARPVPAPV